MSVIDVVRPSMTLDEVERRIAESPMMVADTETDGLDWKRNRVCGWVLGFGPRVADTVYLPVRHGGGANMDPEIVARCVRSGIRRNPRIRLVGFSTSFDLKMMANEGIGLDDFEEPFEDAQINAFLVDERQRSFSLDSCCKFAGVEEKKGEELYKYLASRFGGEANRDQMANYHKLAGNDPIGVEYAIGDSVSTWALWEAQQKPLDDEDLRDIWMIERRCIRALTRMELLGVRVDEERLAYVRRLVAARVEIARSKLPKDFNPRAPSQMTKLFRDAGITGWPTTDKGNPSFAEDWLMTTPLGQSVVAVRKLTHLENSFLTPMAERHIFNGRVHTTFNQTRGEEFGTTTGRLSSSNPNMQQIPKRDSVLGSLFRSIFLPDAGRLMRAEDLSQAEPRLLAHYGEVKLLAEGYLSDPPIDAHSMVAKAARISRRHGKSLNQALLTGAGNAKAASMLGIPMAEAMDVVNAYFASMPEIKPFQRRASNVFIQRGWLRSLLGRRSRLDNVKFAYKAVNRLLQMGNADILKEAMARSDEFLGANEWRAQMLINIHDEIVFQFDPDVGRDDMNTCIGFMKDFGPSGQSTYLAVPIDTEGKEGTNLAEASYGRDEVVNAFAEMGGTYE